MLKVFKSHLYPWSPLSQNIWSLSKLKPDWPVAFPGAEKREHKKDPSKNQENNSIYSLSYPRVSNRRIRPTTFICYHRLKTIHISTSWVVIKEIQPFKVTSCANSKCRAWAKALEQAVSMEAVLWWKWSWHRHWTAYGIWIRISYQNWKVGKKGDVWVCGREERKEGKK